MRLSHMSSVEFAFARFARHSAYSTAHAQLHKHAGELQV